ncbi:ATP-binding protein [Paenibacillus xerothermodurans]|uniref:ATP-binding protein n=2 Tax=Paenibacillus xerothermodurans TaxID=1977292 RepID=A0A2W1P1T4_PAEXE|nr:ATP-binding protein [Paenibacillus xerothermodurans]
MSMQLLFNMADDCCVGVVNRVDSYRVHIAVPDDMLLRKVHVNGYVLLHTSDPNTRLVGRIERVVWLEPEQQKLEEDAEEQYEYIVNNDVCVNALGTLKGPGGGREKTSFTRAVELLPEIGAKCFLLAGPYLTAFTGLVAEESVGLSNPLCLGSYTIAPDAKAIIDGNVFFQRHAMVVGSTGSGKSWTAAKIIEQVAGLDSSNMLIFDLHGEYAPLTDHPNIVRYRIAGPSDLESPGDDVIFLPYWLLGYEDMLALVLDRSDDNAPNQAMAFSCAVINAKRKALQEAEMLEELRTFTIDSPVPYDMEHVAAELDYLNREKVLNRSTGKENNGPFNGRFSRFLPRLSAKRSDRRHGFLFHLGGEQLQADYLHKLVDQLMHYNRPPRAGVKIVDFSEVPSDILPIIISLVAKLVLQVQQWSHAENRYPISLVCDEAHLYLPNRHSAGAAELRALAHFERIAKEGRKYGVNLLIISQRPSELSTTVLSQCNNVVALRLSNQSDKLAVSNLLPENLGGIQEILPTLGVGEAVIVGDACLLPSRIKIDEPEYKPSSGSVQFWDIWAEPNAKQDLTGAVRNMWRQST